MPDGGQLTIKVAPVELNHDPELAAGNYVRLSVSDTGAGMTPEVMARAFEPFFTTKEPGKGTGLGLSTSYSIVTEKHRGQIQVESRPGMTRFTVRLPLGAGPEPVAAGEAQAQRE